MFYYTKKLSPDDKRETGKKLVRRGLCVLIVVLGLYVVSGLAYAVLPRVIVSSSGRVLGIAQSEVVGKSAVEIADKFHLMGTRYNADGVIDAVYVRPSRLYSWVHYSGYDHYLLCHIENGNCIRMEEAKISEIDAILWENKPQPPVLFDENEIESEALYQNLQELVKGDSFLRYVMLVGEDYNMSNTYRFDDGKIEVYMSFELYADGRAEAVVDEVKVITDDSIFLREMLDMFFAPFWRIWLL